MAKNAILVNIKVLLTQKRPMEIFVLDLDHLEEVKTKPKWGTNSLEHFFTYVSKETWCEKLKLGDYVRVQNPRTKVWEDKAKIIGVMKYDRSYLLEDIEDGKVSRKNRRFLKAMQSTELTGQRKNSGLGGPEKRDKICSQQNAQVHQNQREDSPNRNLTPRRSARIAKQNENSV